MQVSKPDNKVSVTFVVSGQAVTEEFPVNEPLHAAVRHMLGKTKNQGQPIENWVLTLDGRELNLQQTFAEAGISNGVKLLLNIRVGRGG